MAVAPRRPEPRAVPGGVACRGEEATRPPDASAIPLPLPTLCLPLLQVVDALVSAGVAAELIFGAMERRRPTVEEDAQAANAKYLAGKIRYAGPDLIDEEGRGVRFIPLPPLPQR